jgi:hypothetical protein
MYMFCFICLYVYYEITQYMKILQCDALEYDKYYD